MHEPRETLELQAAEPPRDELAAPGHAVVWHEYPMEHSVGIEKLGEVERFLRQVLAAPGP